MAKLAYFGTRVSPNQIVSKHGYLVCLNVPICRTGTQSYLGSELEGHPGYDPAWGLSPNERYDVLRTLEEVTNAATVASFEGNSVVDEHPEATQYPGSLVTCENDSELNRGHGQNIRVGGLESLENGETPLLADLHVKNIDLIRKVDEQGIRDVSCGYTFFLVQREDGTLVQTLIRGNHIAIVPNGRAGPEIAIGDTAIPPPKPKEKKPMPKNIRNWLFGRGLMAAAAATDADPEEIAEMAREGAKDADMEEPPMKDKASKDAEEKAEKAAKEKKAAEDVEKHPEGCRCGDYMPAGKDKAAKDKAAKDKAGKDAPTVEELEEVPSAEVIGDSTDPSLKLDNVGESELKGKGVLDSARELVKVLKPWVGSGEAPKAAVDAYNAHVKALNATKGNPFTDFVNITPPAKAAADAAAKPTINPRSLFEGRTYAEGQAAYRAYREQGGK